MRMQLGGLKEHRLAIYRARTGAPTDRTTRNHMLVGLGVWVAAFAVLAVLLGGCATMAANQAEQAKWQTLADQATQKFHTSPVTVIIKETAGYGGQYQRQERTIWLGPSTEFSMKLVLAHELGHHILGHTNQYLEQEQEANAKAVEILQVWGMSEEEAFRGWGNRLLGSQQRAGSHPTPGHAYCQELANLWARYPQYKAKDPAKLEAICPGSTAVLHDGRIPRR